MNNGKARRLLSYHLADDGWQSANRLSQNWTVKTYFRLIIIVILIGRERRPHCLERHMALFYVKKFKYTLKRCFHGLLIRFLWLYIFIIPTLANFNEVVSLISEELKKNTPIVFSF